MVIHPDERLELLERLGALREFIEGNQTRKSRVHVVIVDECGQERARSEGFLSDVIETDLTHAMDAALAYWGLLNAAEDLGWRRE